MAQGVTPLRVLSHRGGLSEEPPNSLREDECTVAENVEFWHSMLGERRGGCSALSLTSSGLTSEAAMSHISEWYPTNVITLPEYFAAAATPATSISFARRDTAGTWHTLTPNDAMSFTAPEVYQIRTQPLDTVLYIAGKAGSTNRSHAWDGTNWRRTGIAVPAAPTGADTATTGRFAGTRYYRQRDVVMSGSTVLLRSEPGPVLTFAPSGTKNGATITKGASASGETTTHWELEASLDNANFYRIARTINATTTATDNTTGPKTFPTVVASAPGATDGSGVTYVLLSNQAAQLNLTGTVSNGSYSDGTNITGRGWIGYDGSAVYIPMTPTTAWATTQNWYASPDVATTLEAASAGGEGGDYADIGVLSEAIGAYLTMGSVKYLTVEGDRLVFAGNHTSAALASTVGWTPPGNDPGVGNAERVPVVTTGGDEITSTVDLDNYDGGAITGLESSVQGTWFAFKWQRIYGATRSKNTAQAYNIDTLSTTRGAVDGSVVKAQDSHGNTVIYFLDPFAGPCQLTAGGVVKEILGLPDTWARVNLKATSLTACGQFYPLKQQVIWTLSVDGGNVPTAGIKLHTSELREDEDGFLHGGWATFTGKIATARCMAALTYTDGNLTTRWPFYGLPGSDFLVRGDNGVSDNGTTFVGTVVGHPRYAGGLLSMWQALKAAFLATAETGGSVIMKLIKNQSDVAAVSLPTPLDASASGEEQVVKVLENLVLAEANCIQVAFTDGGTNTPWHIQQAELLPASSGDAG